VLVRDHHPTYPSKISTQQRENRWPCYVDEIISRLSLGEMDVASSRSARDIIIHRYVPRGEGDMGKGRHYG